MRVHMNFIKRYLTIFIWVVIPMQIIPKPSAPNRVPFYENKTNGEGVLFGANPNAPMYWKALMLAANNKKEAAVDLVKQIKAGDIQFDAMHFDLDVADDFFDYLFISGAARAPQLLTYLGIFESIGIREHNAFLDEVSPAAIELGALEHQKNFQTLREFSTKNMTPEQQLSYKIFAWKLEHENRGMQFLYHDYKISQMFGVLSDLSMTLMEFHRLEHLEDCEHYLSRLAGVSKYFDQTIELLEHQLNLGIMPPAFALEKVILIIDNSLPQVIEDNMYYLNLIKKAEKIENINKDDLSKRAKDVLQNHVYPAYKKLKDYCQQLLNQTNGANNGVWALPNGDAYYTHVLARHTTTNLTANEIHELGIKEVAQIHAQMRVIFAHEGLDDAAKTVGQLMQDLAKDERFYFPETEEGRQQCIAEFEAIIERARKELYPLFDIMPKAQLRIQPVPKHEEEGQAGAYYAPASIDGSRPGIFFANLRSMREMPTYHMETLAIHEAEPGHHFQIALQQEMDMPLLRKLGDYNVFYEGWALYTEKLAYEQGFYSSSFAQLGHLGDELFRAARLVVDTGIHHKRWSREQAIDYMVEVTGMHRSSAATEVERYFVYPGQACSYKIGQLKLLELRKRMKDALGNKFDIREFHNVVLKLGAAPIIVLEEVIDRYIKEKK